MYLRSASGSEAILMSSSSDTWLVRRSTRVVSTAWSGFAERTARKPATGRRVLSGRGLLTEVILSNKRHNRDCVGLTKAKVNSLPGQMYVLGKDGPSLRDSCGRKTQAWQRLLNRPTRCPYLLVFRTRQSFHGRIGEINRQLTPAPQPGRCSCGNLRPRGSIGNSYGGRGLSAEARTARVGLF